MIFGLGEKTHKELLNLFDQYPNIHEVIIYESPGMVDYQDDINFELVLKGEKLDNSDLFAIQYEIANSYLPKEFEVMLYHTITSQELLDYIKKEGKILYKKNIPEAKKPENPGSLDWLFE